MALIRSEIIIFELEIFALSLGINMIQSLEEFLEFSIQESFGYWKNYQSFFNEGFIIRADYVLTLQLRNCLLKSCRQLDTRFQCY